jgi:prepilin-type processing-associated H-X9-DG protein
MRQMAGAFQTYSNEYNGLLPFYGGYDANFAGVFNKKTPSDELHPYVAYRGDKAPWLISNSTNPWTVVPMRLACLYAAGIINDARMFYCPANEDPNFQYESYVNPTAPNTSNAWGTLPQQFNTDHQGNQWVRFGYTYYPIDKNLKTSSGMMTVVGGTLVPKVTPRRYDTIDARYPYLTDLIWYKKDISHKAEIDPTTNKLIGAGINALFIDGHVSFNKDGPVTYTFNGTTKTRKLFDNDYWDIWEPAGGMSPEGMDIRYILYPIYKMIQP